MSRSLSVYRTRYTFQDIAKRDTKCKVRGRQKKGRVKWIDTKWLLVTKVRVAGTYVRTYVYVYVHTCMCSVIFNWRLETK